MAEAEGVRVGQANMTPRETVEATEITGAAHMEEQDNIHQQGLSESAEENYSPVAAEEVAEAGQELQQVVLPEAAEAQDTEETALLFPTQPCVITEKVHVRTLAEVEVAERWLYIPMINRFTDRFGLPLVPEVQALSLSATINKGV